MCNITNAVSHHIIYAKYNKPYITSNHICTIQQALHHITSDMYNTTSPASRYSRQFLARNEDPAYNHGFHPDCLMIISKLN